MSRSHDTDAPLPSAEQRGGAHWLLWMTGAAAMAIGAVALMLWGTRSGPALLDLVAMICA